MLPEKYSAKIVFALIILRATITFICLMTIVTCISAIVHGASFTHQILLRPNAIVQNNFTPKSSSAHHSIQSDVHNEILYPSEFDKNVDNNILSYPSFASPQASPPPPVFTKDPREQLFFQYLTLFLLIVSTLMTCLKDWPSLRQIICLHSRLTVASKKPYFNDQQSTRNQDGGRNEGEFGNELKLSYSFPRIGASYTMIGSIILAMNLGSNPVWRFFDWQTSLMDGFGYAILVSGIIYIFIGLGPWRLRQLRDSSAS